LRAMQAAGNEMNIVILDACRDNPLPKTRGIARGLARMDAPTGTFIAFAAAPGQVALDGTKGTHGVFTGELIKAMAEPNVPLEQMFKKVIAGVNADTHGQQQPWSEASIQGDFYFHSVAVVATPSPGFDPKQIELEFWASIKNSRDAQDFRAYLERYPQGDFAALAANRVKQLQPVQRAVLTTPASTAPLSSPVAAGTKRQSASRCELLQERAQLGETLDAEDRAYVKAKCQ
jgi:hypothetical protein